MSIAERIEKDYVDAYKAKEKVRLETLRLLKTAAKNRQVELKLSLVSLSDDEYMSVLLRQVKQRQESIEVFRSAGRNELADKEQAELEILQEYLPKQLSEEEIHAIIEKVCGPFLAEGMKAMGKVIKSIMDAYKGQVDGKFVSEAVKARLQKG
ncbi:MAG: GatB/YqeY domain-containing protein [Mailhella sp.]